MTPQPTISDAAAIMASKVFIANSPFCWVGVPSSQSPAGQSLDQKNVSNLKHNDQTISQPIKVGEDDWGRNSSAEDFLRLDYKLKY